jgi:hypothetical protein
MAGSKAEARCSLGRAVTLDEVVNGPDGIGQVPMF